MADDFDPAKSFMFMGRKHNYIDHRVARNTERRVELSLGHYFLHKHKPNIIEVGNVMRAYWPKHQHHVVDLNEKRPGWANYENKDVLTYTPKKKYAAALSISTLEHTADVMAGVERVLSWAPNALITIPLGYVDHKRGGHTTQFVKDNEWPEVGVSFLLRISEDNRWKELTRNQFMAMPEEEYRYGQKYGTATLIAVFVRGPH